MSSRNFGSVPRLLANCRYLFGISNVLIQAGICAYKFQKLSVDCTTCRWKKRFADKTFTIGCMTSPPISLRYYPGLNFQVIIVGITTEELEILHRFQFLSQQLAADLGSFRSSYLILALLAARSFSTSNHSQLRVGRDVCFPNRSGGLHRPQDGIAKISKT